MSETGWIEGSAQATNVILNGTVRGDIVAADRVALGPLAKVHGDVHYGVIETALGAEILGRLVPSPVDRSAKRSGAAAADRTATSEPGSTGEGALVGQGKPAEPSETA